MELLFFIISLFATIIGAIAGLGGGIIIKPTLDAIGIYNVSTICILSAITVLSMATVSSIKFIKSGIKFDLKIIILSIGAILGGILGNYLFEIFSKTLSDEIAKCIQALILIFLLIFVIFRKHYPHYNIKNKFIIIIAGLFMGLISSFLGIGGGPVNVVIICIIFSISVRDSAVYSIFVIFFSQLSNVLATVITQDLHNYNLEMLVFMIPAAILGGFIGAFLNRKLSKRAVENIFNIVMILIISINVYNVFAFYFK